MSDVNTKTTAPRQNSSGLHNDFFSQEETMTNGAMPPTFQLTASAAGSSPGHAKASGGNAAKNKLKVEGVPAELVALLEYHEGVKYVAYEDNGNVSGGMGHLIATKEEQDKYPIGTPIPKSVVEAWARKDVGAAWNAAREQAKMLGVDSHEFKVALASMSFQNGLYWWKEHEDTWTLMKGHHWESAAIEAARSEWAKQTASRMNEFQAALRKLAGITLTEDRSLASTFKGLAGEAKAMSGGKQPTVKPPVGAKGETALSPLSSEKVKQVQTKLKELGDYKGAVDGKEFLTNGTESNTTKGIRLFQQKNGLPVTGSVDQATWDKLFGMQDDGTIWDRFKTKMDEQKNEGQKPKPDRGWGTDPMPKTNAETTSNTFVDKKYFVSQSPDATGSVRATKPGWSNCRQAATDIAIRYLQGEKPEIAKELSIEVIDDLVFGEGHLRLLSEDKSHKQEIPSGKEAVNFKNDEWLLPHSQQQMAIDYIDEKLTAGIPVVVGVDHTYNRLLSIKAASPIGNGYNEGTTDHFVTLVGAGKDEQGRKFYTYFEVGTVQSFGYSPNNKLVETSPGLFTRPEGNGPGQGSGAWGNQEYHISTVLIYKGDRSRFETEIAENQQ